MFFFLTILYKNTRLGSKSPSQNLIQLRPWYGQYLISTCSCVQLGSFHRVWNRLRAAHIFRHDRFEHENHYSTDRRTVSYGNCVRHKKITLIIRFVYKKTCTCYFLPVTALSTTNEFRPSTARRHGTVISRRTNLLFNLLLWFSVFGLFRRP